jgi:predicted glutamine amidotransferase
MCRIFAVRAVEPWAVAPAFASLKQLSVQHKDGWGVVLFDEKGPTQHKDVCPFHASESFHALTRDLKSRNLLAHIREASVGGAHPDNTHPFSAGPWVFCHNGTVRGFDEEPKLLENRIAEKWRGSIRGDTDSERCFYLFLTHLEGRTDLASVSTALMRTMREVAALYDGKSEKPTALNLLVTDGRILAVTRHGKSLFRVARAGVHMIASEPVVDDEVWHEIPDDHLFTLDEQLNARVAAIPPSP